MVYLFIFEVWVSKNMFVNELRKEGEWTSYCDVDVVVFNLLWDVRGGVWHIWKHLGAS